MYVHVRTRERRGDTVLLINDARRPFDGTRNLLIPRGGSARAKPVFDAALACFSMSIYPVRLSLSHPASFS